MKNKKALLVDDDAEHRELLTRLLKERGYQVQSYVSPISFMLRREGHCNPSSGHCFDLIVTGAKLPGMNGIDFLHRIKNNGCCLPSHRIGVFSHNWDESSLKRVEHLGCRHFTKPVAIEQLDRWLSL